MAQINLLDDSTIDKIAAGEVVERPASVVKELVENAIDSGATAISVEIKDGGISYIRVTDNGCGIEKTEVKKAFLRHATSKINNVLDLFRISSLGFRGEALSSICAVSSVELLTKTSEDFSGIRYVISGNREEVFEDAGVPSGTTIIVRNLFFNTPARKKFLKSPNTEAGYISDLMECLVLSHPEISFKYMVNGIDRIVSPGNKDIMSVIYSVFGRDAVKGMLPIDFNVNDTHVYGYVGKPELARGNKNFEFFFVNDRYIKSRVLSAAVEEPYKSRLMLHKFPFVIIYLDIDPAKIDINVHPAKTEIKFLDESLLFSGISQNISSVLSESEMIPAVSNEQKPAVNNEQKPAVTATISSLQSLYEKSTVSSDMLFENEEDITDDNSDDRSEDNKKAPEPFEAKRIETLKNVFPDIPEIKDAEQLQLDTARFLSSESLKKHIMIGQLFDTYWLIQYEDNLYIIDQHAAHEKVLYERLMKHFIEDNVSSQMISPPIIVSLSNSEEAALNKYSANLINMGFEWEHFGGHEYSINAVPTDLYEMSVTDYFITVLDDLCEGHFKAPDAVNHRIATMACKAAIKGNMSFTRSEAEALINELLTLDNPYNCPHGRPCIISYSKSELEKLFKRIV